MTLGQARALSRADVAFIVKGAHEACLSLLRRDADIRAIARMEDARTALAQLPPGQIAVAIVALSEA